MQSSSLSGPWSGLHHLRRVMGAVVQLLWTEPLQQVLLVLRPSPVSICRRTHSLMSARVKDHNQMSHVHSGLMNTRLDLYKESSSLFPWERPSVTNSDTALTGATATSNLKHGGKNRVPGWLGNMSTLTFDPRSLLKTFTSSFCYIQDFNHSRKRRNHI